MTDDAISRVSDEPIDNALRPRLPFPTDADESSRAAASPSIRSGHNNVAPWPVAHHGGYLTHARTAQRSITAHDPHRAHPARRLGLGAQSGVDRRAGWASQGSGLVFGVRRVIVPAYSLFSGRIETGGGWCACSGFQQIQGGQQMGSLDVSEGSGRRAKQRSTWGRAQRSAKLGPPT